MADLIIVGTKVVGTLVLLSHRRHPLGGITEMITVGLKVVVMLISFLICFRNLRGSTELITVGLRDTGTLIRLSIRHHHLRGIADILIVGVEVVVTAMSQPFLRRLRGITVLFTVVMEEVGVPVRLHVGVQLLKAITDLILGGI